jgi:hypothetical protein
MGHIATNCPNSKGQVRKGKYKRHHAHATEDDEHDHEKTKEEDLSEEYVLISTLTCKVTHGSDTWLIDSGASKHMTGYKESLSDLVQKDSPHKVKILQVRFRKTYEDEGCFLCTWFEEESPFYLSSG